MRRAAQAPEMALLLGVASERRQLEACFQPLPTARILAEGISTDSLFARHVKER
jgi:hypothetical protein